MYSVIIWQGNYLGYFSKNWANFLPNHLVTLSPNKVGLFSKTFLSVAILDWGPVANIINFLGP
jgi:hypothetical protein